MAAALAPVHGPPLQRIDRAIRARRLRQVRRFLPAGAKVLDVGCYDGALFSAFGNRVAEGVGVDPMLQRSGQRGRFRFIADGFPTAEIGSENFDVITLLAVLEHVSVRQLPVWRDACERLLAPNGVIVATVPSPRVDDLLHVLMRLRLVAGMSVHEHHGFDPEAVPRIFAGADLALIERRRFELGLNNLFVFGRGT
jgi:2-polyprenyl-3-methyl-5-hydroxy-6-metoxy-1,4-benzoquinol methylase